MHIVVHQPGITRLVQLRQRRLIEAVLQAIETPPDAPEGERRDGDPAVAPPGAPLRAARARFDDNSVDAV